MPFLVYYYIKHKPYFPPYRTKPYRQNSTIIKILPFFFLRVKLRVR